jgi:hypothetical protein
MSNSKLIGTQATHDKKESRKVMAVPKGEFKVAKIFHILIQSSKMVV